MKEGILIADSGSTKTDWALLTKGEENALYFCSEGINPIQESPRSIIDKIAKIHSQIPDNYRINNIHFFGAGCATPHLTDIISKSISLSFPDSEIEVKSDLIGAALSLFGDGKGIACILGTGSNSCEFSGGKIVSQTPSLGYILGDEGSGSSLGKKIINRVYKKNLDGELIKKFKKTYPLTLEEIIERVYKDVRPAAFLASFATFMIENINHPEIRDIVKSDFTDFFERNILPYNSCKELQIGIVGSIGFYFKNYLIDVAQNMGLNVTLILKSPINNLCAYYLKKLNP